MATTQTIIDNAINRSKSLYYSMDAIAKATTLTWPQINSSIEFIRAAKGPAEVLVSVWNQVTERGMPSAFKSQLGADIDASVLLPAVRVNAELYIDEAEALFNLGNVRAKTLDGDANRIFDYKVFTSPQIDALKAAAAIVRDQLVDFK